MDVLFLSHGYPRTATDPIGSFVLRLAVALRDEDVRVSVVAPSAPGLAAKEEFEGIPVFRFRYAPRRYETLAYTGSMLAQVQGSIAGKLSILSFLGGEHGSSACGGLAASPGARARALVVSRRRGRREGRLAADDRRWSPRCTGRT